MTDSVPPRSALQATTAMVVACLLSASTAWAIKEPHISTPLHLMSPSGGEHVESIDNSTLVPSTTRKLSDTPPEGGEYLISHAFNRTKNTVDSKRLPTKLPPPSWPYQATQRAADIRWPIVFLAANRSQIAQTDNTNGDAISAEASSMADKMPEVAALLDKFIVADLMYLDTDGNERVLFDCRNSKTPCSVTDPAVSPDATRVLFAVHYAKEWRTENWTYKGPRLVERHIKDTYKTVVMVHDLRTGKTRPVLPKGVNDQPDGIIDAYPDWKSNTRIKFTSNRAKQYALYRRTKPANYPWALQRYEMNLDGTDLVRTGANDDVALHPTQLPNGSEVFSTWWMDGCRDRKGRKRPDGHTAIPGGVLDQPCNGMGDTGTNVFHLSVAKHNSDQQFIACCVHGSLHRWTDRKARSKVAINNAAPISPTKVAFNFYYRANKLSTGEIGIIDLAALPYAVEGAGDRLYPDIQNLAADDIYEEKDTMPKKADGLWLGGLNWPAATPLKHKGLLFSWGKGICFSYAKDEYWNDEFLNGSPGCDWGIYFTNEIPVKNHNDYVKLVDRPDRHEFAARVVATYQELFGVPEPVAEEMPVDRDESGEPFCSIKIVDARRADLHVGLRREDDGFAGTRHKSRILPGYAMDGSDTVAIAVYEALPNTVSQKAYYRAGNDKPPLGHRTRLLGFAMPERDGSIWARVPCDTPYYLSAYAQDKGKPGKYVEYLHDQFKQVSRAPGEGRICHGCHSRHTELAAAEAGPVEGEFANTIAASKPPQLLKPKIAYSGPTRSPAALPFDASAGPPPGPTEPKPQDRRYGTLIKLPPSPKPNTERTDTGRALPRAPQGTTAGLPPIPAYISSPTVRRDALSRPPQQLQSRASPNDAGPTPPPTQATTALEPMPNVSQPPDETSVFVESPDKQYGTWITVDLTKPHENYTSKCRGGRCTVVVGTMHLGHPESYGFNDPSVDSCATDWPVAISYTPGSDSYQLVIKSHAAGATDHGMPQQPPIANDDQVSILTLDGTRQPNCPAEAWVAYTGDQPSGQLPIPIRRIHLLALYAAQHFNIDFEKGIPMEGTSMGTSAVHWRSLLLPHPFGTSVHSTELRLPYYDLAYNRRVFKARLAHANTRTVLGMLDILPLGEGPLEDGGPPIVSPEQATARYVNIHRKLRCSSTDAYYVQGSGVNQCAEQSILQEELRAGGVVVMNANLHRVHQVVGVNLPSWSAWKGKFENEPWPAFFGSTGNHPETDAQRRDVITFPRQHVNLGLQWNADATQETTDRVAFSIRYIAQTNLTDPGFEPAIPDQPQTITFGVVPRRLSAFQLGDGERLNWSLGTQSGVATAAGNEIAIEGLRLNSGEDWATLSITKN